MAKEIIFSDNARNRLFAGVEKLCDAVKVTMGPRVAKWVASCETGCGLRNGLRGVENLEWNNLESGNWNLE